MDGGGNAARAGLKSGDQVLYTSSFFGDELWPADKLGFTKTAIQAKPDSVYFVVNRLSFLSFDFILLLFNLYYFYNVIENCKENTKMKEVEEKRFNSFVNYMVSVV